MLIIDYLTLCGNAKAYMDKVADECETIIVTREDNRNVVMLSQESYDNLMGNIYIIGSKNNYDWLMESKMQLKRGKCILHDSI